MGIAGHGTLDVNAWVAVYDGCEISCTVNQGTGVSATVKGTNPRRGPGGSDEFEFWFGTEALREFLVLGAKALAELDSAAAEDTADPTPAPVVEVVEVGDRARGTRGVG